MRLRHRYLKKKKKAQKFPNTYFFPFPQTTLSSLFLFGAGGFNGISRMCSGEKYNPATNAWSHIPDMYNPRSNFAIEVIDDMIFAIGGFNGVTTIFHVECYDEKTNEW